MINFPSNISFPPKIPLANTPTPLQHLERWSSRYQGCRVWVKRDDLTGAAASGNKIRKLEYVFADAQMNNADVVITAGAVQSNHCRATAILARQLGLDVHLILRGAKPEHSEGNLLLDKFVGARIDYCRLREYQALNASHFATLIERYVSEGKKAYEIPVGASNEIGLWGYIEAFFEIMQQCRAQGFTPDAIVCATGSGGTHAGLAVASVLADVKIPIYGMAVCDDAAYFHRRVEDDLALFNRRYNHAIKDVANFMVDDAFIGQGYGRADVAHWQLMQSLAMEEGLVLDPVYTGKAFYGMDYRLRHQWANYKNVVFVHTGGIFGLLAQGRNFDEVLR